jgi:putative Mg2+ transporter-C (MgtC) family protein
MDTLLQELTGGIPNLETLIRVSLRLMVAAACGGVIGWERRRSGHAAGLRTHMLVSMGATVFVLAIIERGGSSADVSRVIQGIVTGIGFLGAGTILKQEVGHRVKGLTTAADIWVTAAIGTAVGAGFHLIALLATVFTWFTLAYLYIVEERATKSQAGPTPEQPPTRSSAEETTEPRDCS